MAQRWRLKIWNALVNCKLKTYLRTKEKSHKSGVDATWGSALKL